MQEIEIVDQSRRARVDESARDYEEAKDLADRQSMILRYFTPIHYQLVHRVDRWILNVYPSNQRLYADPHRKPPYVDMRDERSPWTVLDVVRAAIKAVARKSQS